MLVFGILGFVMEENDFSVAPAILRIVLGLMLEQNLFNSMIRADGNVLAFFYRPIAGVAGFSTIVIWLGMAWFGARSVRPDRQRRIGGSRRQSDCTTMRRSQK